jgi:Tfp pilus assembly protein FimV
VTVGVTTVEALIVGEVMTAAIRTRNSHDYLRVERRPRPRQRPNYAIRRAVATTIVVVLLAAAAVAVSAMVGVVVDVGGRPAAASDIDTSTTSGQRSHVAQPGDTLWSIANHYRDDIGRGRFVDALIDLNGGTSIQAGQTVHLP